MSGATTDRIYLAELTWREVRQVLDGDRNPVILLPTGAIEPHGPHAPLETDSIISQGMCKRAAQQLTDDRELRVLVAPPLHYGVTRYGAAFPGAVGITERTLMSLVVEVCSALIEDGFRCLVLVNNHFEPEHRSTLRRAVDAIGVDRDARIGYLDLPRRRNAERLTEEFLSGAAHAGRYETSLVMADRPDLVNTEVMAALAARSVDMPTAMAAGARDFLAMGMDQAYCGAPAEASAEEGMDTFATLTQMLIESIRDVAGAGDE